MSSDEEMKRSSTDGERSAVDALNVEQFQEQATEPCTSEKTVGSFNADPQGAPPTADVQKLQEEMADMKVQLNTSLDRLQSVTDQPGTFSDARRLEEQCRQLWSDVLQQLLRVTTKRLDVLIKDARNSFSDVTQSVTNVPHEYRLDTQDASNSSGDAMHNQVEVVLINKASAPTDSASVTGGQEVHRVKVTPESTTLNLKSGPVRVNTITDDAIQQADKNVLITKIDWDGELARVQELKREKQRLVRQLEREQVTGQQQQEARERAEKQLEDLYRRHKEEKKKEQERVKNFYMGIVRGKNQHLKGLMEKIGASESLRDVIQHLFEDCNVRLLGIDSGLRFLMDVPSEEYEEVLRQQDHIKKLLEQKFFPDQKAQWTQVTSCDLPSEESDLQLGQPLPVLTQSQDIQDDSISFSDVTQCVTNVPHEYLLDTQDASNSSGDVTHDQVEVVLVNKASASTDSASATGSQEVHRVKVTPQSTTLNLNSGPVRVNTITDDAIQQADKNVLITKIDWDGELARVQELKREKQRLVSQLEREQVTGQQQQEARERAEKQLADLYRRHKEEKKKEQERVKNFYMGIVSGKNQHLKGLMEKIEASDGLRDVIQHLFEDFDVRLLGIDSGLRFLMDVPSEEYEEVLRQQDHIKKLLEQKFFPDQKAQWTQVTSCDLPSEESGLQLGQPLPVLTQSQVSANVTTGEVPSASGGVSFDPMTTTPRRVFVSDIAADGGTSGRRSDIKAIIATGNGQIVMADGKNKTVKVADMTNQDTVSDITLGDQPLALALLHDGQVVVTSFTRKLHLVDVSGPPSVVSRVQTARQYWGVSAGTTDDTLIVSCRTEGHKLARVDVITYNGDVIQTVIDSNTLKDLWSPDYLSVVGGDVIVSNYSTNTVYRVELATGRVVATLTHPDMKEPQQVCADPSGNIYIACSDSKCVLVMSADGQWRRLLEGSQHGDKGCVAPWGVYVMGSHIVVSWRGDVGRTAVSAYDLT